MQKAGLQFVDPLTVSVATAIQLSGLGRTTIYAMLSADEIESLRVRGRKLIIYASLKNRLAANAASAETVSEDDAGS